MSLEVIMVCGNTKEREQLFLLSGSEVGGLGCRICGSSVN